MKLFDTQTTQMRVKRNGLQRKTMIVASLAMAIALTTSLTFNTVAHAQTSTATDALAALTPAYMQSLLAKSGTAGAVYALVNRPSDRDYHRVDLITFDPTTLRPISRTPTEMGCSRVHATSDGKVFFSPPTGYIYSRNFTLETSYPKGLGSVSRARISKDGKFTASTAFTTGHSYLGVGGTTFSTATFIGNASDAKSQDNIQRWPVLNKGVEIKSTDLNLWGVTFDPANSDRFLVTAYFDTKPYLAEGSVQNRKINVLKEAVECPSFSPNGKRIAFKKRTGIAKWSPAVMDLATMKETIFDLPDSVDDQIEWLNDDTLIYEVVNTPLVGPSAVNLMTLNLRDAKPQQRLWLTDARSPTIVRVAKP
jgi:predicted secreted protein